MPVVRREKPYPPAAGVPHRNDRAGETCRPGPQLNFGDDFLLVLTSLEPEIPVERRNHQIDALLAHMPPLKTWLFLMPLSGTGRAQKDCPAIPRPRRSAGI